MPKRRVLEKSSPRECRLLVVDHAVEMGGAEILLVNFLDHIDKRRFRIGLACPSDGPLTAAARERGIGVFLGHPSARLLRVKRTSLGNKGAAALLYPLDLLVSVARLARLIKKEKIDVVMTNSEKAHVYGSLAAFLARRPAVWRLHDIVERGTFSGLNIALLRLSSLFASRILAISGAVGEAIAAAGVRPEKVAVIPNGVATCEPAGAGGRERRSTWSGLDLGEDTILIGFVGRLVPWKGPEYFVRAAAMVAEKMPQARFLVVGEAIYGEREYVEGLKRLAGELGLEEKLVFTGFVERVGEVMGTLDLLVHTSILPEPFGLVLVEAMMAGVPVVAAAGGGVREIVENGVTGLVVPPANEEAIAAAVLDVLSDLDRARAMGKRGRERALRLFDIRAMTARIEEELMGARRGGG